MIELRLPNVSLEAKLDLVAAALLAIREAHRDGIAPRAWEEIGHAHLHLCEAILHATARPPARHLSAPIFLTTSEPSAEPVVRKIRSEKLNPPVKIGEDGLCTCTCATPCPLGKVGSLTRCHRTELAAAGISLYLP